MTNDAMIEIVIDNVKEVLSDNDEPVGHVTPETIIFGSDGVLDSLGLVSLVVKLEEIIAETFGQDVQIVDEDVLFNSENNPMKTPTSLAALILDKLDEK